MRLFFFDMELLTIKQASEFATEFLNKPVVMSHISYLVHYGKIKKYVFHVAVDSNGSVEPDHMGITSSDLIFDLPGHYGVRIEFWPQGEKPYRIVFHKLKANNEAPREVPEEIQSLWNETMIVLNDRAMTSLGGIDFNPDQWDLGFANGQQIHFHFDPVLFEKLQGSPGLRPRIGSIQPLKDLKAFLSPAA